jgi:signal transduction histidine kinase
MRGLGWRPAGLDGRRADAVVALGMVVALELELRSHLEGSHGLVTAAAAVLFAGPISVRRRWPGGSLLICSVVALAQGLLGGHLDAANGIILPPVLLSYGVGAWLDDARGLATLVGGALVFSGYVLSTPTPATIGGLAEDALFLALLFAIPWFVGRLARASNRRAKAFRELAQRAAAESSLHERAAIEAERARIRHELQDIIAHSVSAMIVQSGGARRMLRSEPERARDSILSVEHTGREALADLRRLLGMLRKDDDPRALAPQPGLGQLPALRESMREGGLECRLRYDGAPIDLTPGVDLVSYRVVEAVLLRALHHRCRTAEVVVRYRPERLELEIRGDRADPQIEHELVGIAERVRLYDGTLRPIVADGGGFALLTRLPLRVTVVA